jgi:hypothetical protein
MNNEKSNQFSGPVSVFHEKRLPETATPAGYAALIDRYGLKVPLPRTLAAIGQRHKIYEADRWRLFTPRHTPHDSLEGHLTFALKYEGLDLAVLKRLFMATGPDEIAALVKDKPTGSYARRIWFLYEWLIGEQLDLPDAETGSYVKIVDPKQQWDVTGETVSRQRVKNNLPGTVQFCPLVFRTKELEQFVAEDYAAHAREVVSRVPKDVLARTAAFLLLKDSKSSYAIEGERAPQDRIQRWGRAIGEAGRNKLDDYELLRLQQMVIGDTRFVHLGLRIEGGFVGERERHTRMPLPDHISARHEDLPSLVEGLLAFDEMTKRELDSVIAAAILAFGFVYMHPFEDGNGRIHRYLIHHALSIRGFNPPGVVFPVSAAILDKIDDYRLVLEDYSTRLLPLVEWEPTEKFNVRVLNDTKDFYSYFDATPHAEFLYRCVKQTIEEDLPQEADFLRRYDEFCNQIQTIADMPDSLMDLLFRFLQQNDGRLSQRARTKEFSALSEEEVVKVEKIYEEGFRSDTN